MKLSNSYVSLGESFYQQSSPAAFAKPELCLWNKSLADDLLIPLSLQSDTKALAKYFSGQGFFEGSKPVALAYAGHQFGHFVPQLGDGRAHLLGDVIDKFGNVNEIQLKGSGQSYFSRGGDGRCAIGPAVREFIMSEAMHALGVPSTRCLAVVSTGEEVIRNKAVPGAVLTRIASSHIRVGTFQYFSARGDVESLQKLCDYSLARHYPKLMRKEGCQATLLFKNVVQKQIKLIVEWMRVGFIHGVMNTDNTAISGDTIDYGPCAMMGRYHPDTVFSSIDKVGRYAFANQAHIMQWNMARFAECLLPLVNKDQDKAVQQLLPMIEMMAEKFKQAYIVMMGKKFGLRLLSDEDEVFIHNFLKHMQENRLDYTQTFASLTKSLLTESIDLKLINQLGSLYDDWKHRINHQGLTKLKVYEQMTVQNPMVIPRNHHIEAVIQRCEQTSDFTSIELFLQVLRSPYQVLPGTEYYQDAASDENYQTFCGT